MTDVRLYATADGAELNITNCNVELTNYLETAIYLSISGGNVDDAGESNTKYQYWGNSIGDDAPLRSRTQYLLQSLPITSANLKRIKTAVEYDLAWILNDKLVSKLEVEASLYQVKWVKIDIKTESNQFEFIELWEVYQ